MRSLETVSGDSSISPAQPAKRPAIRTDDRWREKEGSIIRILLGCDHGLVPINNHLYLYSHLYIHGLFNPEHGLMF